MFRYFSKGRRIALALVGLICAPLTAQAACQGDNAAETLRSANPATFAEIVSRADTVPNGKGVFWRIDAPGVPPSYLFGTKHTIDRDFTEMIEPVQAIIRNARLLMVELSSQERAEMSSAMQSNPAMILDMSGRTLEAFMPSALIPQAKIVLAQYGLPYESARRMKPWFLQLVMALPPCAVALQQADEDRVMDNVLAQTARNSGVEVRGLERWEDQLDIFRTMSDHDAETGLIYMIENFAGKAHEHQAVSDLYDTRDIAMIWEFSRWQMVNADYDFATTGEDMFAEYERTLLVARNRQMALNARAEVAKGGVVIAVGALHMIGESGLVAAFQREGYDVTRLD